MSAAAPTTSPAVVRTPSTSRRQQPFNSPSADRPHRTQSSASRPARPTPQQPNLANVARRDYEQSNVAASPASRRSQSRDGAAPSQPDSSRRGHTRYASDASTTSTMPINGVAADSARPRVATDASASTTPKRRTTITAPATGQWSLGKTIGAGSMGKVKLAKSATTGEQVRHGRIARECFMANRALLGCSQDRAPPVD
jgi:hypothetical protein